MAAIDVNSQLVLTVLYILSAFVNGKVEQFEIHPIDDGKLELVCSISNLQADQWIAIYRYYGQFAECLFWEKALGSQWSSESPYTCSGDFDVEEVNIEQGATEGYTRQYKIKLTSVAIGTYFCRVVKKINGVFQVNDEDIDTSQSVEIPQGFEISGVNKERYPLCGASISNTERLVFTPGEDVKITCGIVDQVPLTVDWTRSDGKDVRDYPRVIDHGIAGARSSNNTLVDVYNPSLYVHAETSLTFKLTSNDDGVIFTCESLSNSSNSVKESCTIGPFEEKKQDDNDIPTTPTSPMAHGTILGMDMWLFAFVIAAGSCAILLLIVLLLSICLYKSTKRAKYLLRSRNSTMPIIAHDETEFQDQDNNGYNSHEQELQRRHAAVQIDKESPYSPYPENEFDDDYGPTREPVYSPTPDVMNSTPNGQNVYGNDNDNVYGNTLTRNNHRQESFYENH